MGFKPKTFRILRSQTLLATADPTTGLSTEESKQVCI